MKKHFALLLGLALLAPMVAIGIDYESIINSEATINREVAPDTVSIKFYVEDTGTNVQDVKAKNDKTVNAAIEAIKKVLGNDDSIKTISYSINNIYSYKDKVRIFQKYQVTNGFEVKTKDLDKISSIIKIATDKGVKRVERLNFTLSNSEAVCNEVMAQSAQMAKRRASEIAKSLNSEILKVKNVNTYCSLSSSYVQPRMYANKMLSAGAMEDSTSEAEVSIEPGTINIRANANLSFYLK